MSRTEGKQESHIKKYETKYNGGGTKAISQYVNGELGGTQYGFYDAGIDYPEYVWNYHKGQLEGEQKDYYPPYWGGYLNCSLVAGGLKLLSHYTDGVKTGTWIFFYPDGKVKQIRRYVGGQLHGKQINYPDHGSEEIYYYLNGIVVTPKAYAQYMAPLNQDMADQLNVDERSLVGLINDYV